MIQLAVRIVQHAGQLILKLRVEARPWRELHVIRQRCAALLEAM
ncbi:MAG: hypothetical protein ABL970_07360 [Nitrospira sp.]